MASEASSLWPNRTTAIRLPRRRGVPSPIAVFMSVAVALGFCIFAEVAVSQEPAPKLDAVSSEADTGVKTGPPLEYVTVLCPDERQAELEKEADYRAVAPSQFSEMLRRAYPGLPPAIRSAHYEARFEKDELVEGRALFAIEHLGPIEATLPLEPCNLAVERAGWANRDGEAARLGLGSTGQVVLRIDHGGTLDLAWSMKGTLGTREAVSFDVELPSCPSSRFVLFLPEDRVPVPSRGMVSREGTPVEGMQTWAIELGAANRFSLRIGPSDDPEGHRQNTELREKLVYRIAPGGLVADITLRFDVLGQQPLRRLELLVASELNLESVLDGDVAVPWGEEALPESQLKKVILELEDPIHDLGRELTLTALAPIQLDESWRLPSVSVPGVHWCESVVSLVVQHPLRLNDVSSDQGRISQVQSHLSRTATDGLNLQLFTADARIDVVLGREQTPPKVDYGVMVEMSGGQIAARQKAHFNADEGEHFQVVGNLPQSWVVDAVQAEPPEALADWRIERKGRTKRQLFVDLAQPLSRDAPIQLVVLARRLESTEGRRYSSRDMIPVEFESCQLGTALVALNAGESYQIELTGTDKYLPRDVQDLSLGEQQLFPEAPRGKVCSHGSDANGLNIRVKQRRSLYSAEIEVSLSVTGMQATESYVFRIHPESVRLENVVIELLKRPGSPLRWEPTTGDEPSLEAETSENAAQASNSSQLERWNVRLRPSRSEVFELRARRVFPVEDGAAIGLARLPDAARQNGRLVVGCLGGEGMRVENRTLTPEVSAPLRSVHEIPRSVYCYDPRRSLVSGKPPVVLRVDSTPTAVPQAWVWECRLESRLEPTGRGWHVATYRVESAGASILRLALPASVGLDMVESVEIGGRRAPLESVPVSSPGTLAVRLEEGRRFHDVTVCYRTSESRWSLLQPVNIPVPEPDVPVLKRSWVVWLPPGHQVIDTEGIFQLSNASGRWPANAWGPLGRDSGDPLDPFASTTWQWPTTIEPPRILASPLESKVKNSELAPSDWGELLTRGDLQFVWSGLLSGNNKVLVDVEAVRGRGILPRTPITWLQNGSERDQVRALLDQAGLALAVSGRHVVVTSVTNAVAHGERLPHGDTGVLWQVTDAAWADEIGRAISDASPLLVQASKWRELPLYQEIPWSTLRRPGYEPRDTVGWNVREIELSSSTAATVYVVDRNLFVAGLWFCFLLVAFFTWALALRYPVLALMPIVGFLLGAAFLDDFWTPWLSASFWGSCAGLLIRLVTIRRTKSPGRIVATRKVGESTASVALGGLLVLLIAADTGAQPPKSETRASAPALILAPVGEDGKLTGGDFSVPEPFYLELKDRAERIAEEAPEWLLKDAYYHGAINWQATGEPLTVTEFTAEFSLEVLRKRREVKIPLGETQHNWILEAAWLDGASLETSWDDDGNLVFEAEPSKWSQLRLQLQPIFGYGLEPNGFRLDIPPLVSSRLELTIPAGAPRVEVSTATGRTRQQPLKLEADLGPVDQLVIKWQPTGHAGSGKLTRVDELVWLNFTVGGALVETQFRFELGQDFRDELCLMYDPRLAQRGVYEVEGAKLERVETIQGSSDQQPGDSSKSPRVRQKLILTDDSGVVTVRGEFVLWDMSGIGAMRLPELRSEGCEVARRWVAANVDARLHCEPSTVGEVEKIGLSDFVDAWGGEVDLPTMAFRLNDEDSSFGLITHPKPVQSSVQWEMDVRYGVKGTQFEYRGDVDTSAGYLFCHRLAIPAALEIDAVTATVSDLPRAVRWTRPREDRVVLFFDAPVNARHSFQLRGHTSAEGERSEPLQIIELQDVESEAGTINIYRQTEAIVRLEAVEGMTKVAERLGAIVSRWVVDGLGPPTATARVEPNRPKVVVHEQIISLHQTSEGWAADLDCEIEVQEGTLDRIRIETSELWPGPYVVSPGVTEEAFGEEHAELVLRPSPRNRFRFRVSGPLVPRPGGTTSVPRIRLKDAEYSEQMTRLIVLPTGPVPSIRWDVLGLVPAELPAQFVSKSPGLAWKAYEVRQDDFLVTIRPSSDSAQVHLADYRLAWDANGECRGVAVFDLEAGDSDSCLLHMPSPWRPITVSNHGVPVSPRLREDGRWEIPLGRTVLPQRIELVFVGRIPLAEDGVAKIEAFPELAGLPVLKTLWTVAGDGDFEVVGAGKPIPRQRVAMERLRSVTMLIDPANRRPGSSPGEDEAWYRGWLGEWGDARREARLAVAFAKGAASIRAEQAELEALDKEQQAFAEQWGAAALWEQITSASTSRVTPGTLWDLTERGVTPKHYLTEGGSSPAVLRIESRGTEYGTPLAVSPFLYVPAVLLIVLAAWGTGSIHRWPHLFGAIAGLCWWLWFWPSFVGFVFIAVCLVASVRSGWRRPRSGNSGIVRLSVSGRS